MKSFFLGLGVGTAVGLLIAPQEGNKTRRDWTQLARDWFGNRQRKEISSKLESRLTRKPKN